MKIAIIDDQQLITEGLKRILEAYEDMEVIATGANGEEAIALCKTYEIDVLLMDIRMPVMNGVEAIQGIRTFNSYLKIMMLTTFEDEEYIVQAMASGANGYLFKDIPYDKLVQAIREVYKGQFYMPQKVAQVLAQNISKVTQFQETAKAIQEYGLTEREWEVAKMLRDGFNNKQIAMALYISEGTVKNYVSNIYVKTGTTDRSSCMSLLKDQLKS